MGRVLELLHDGGLVFTSIHVSDEQVSPGHREAHGHVQIQLQRLSGNHHVPGRAPSHPIHKLLLEGVAADRTRVLFTVTADLVLLRRFGVKIQELPLMCRKLLEAAPEDGLTRAWTFTEDQLREQAASRVAAPNWRMPKKKHAGAAVKAQ